MANLAQALDAMLRARYMPKEIRSPLDSKRGYVARLNRLEKLLGTKETTAKAVGVSSRRIRAWRSGETKPRADSLRKLDELYKQLIQRPAAQKRLKAHPVPNSVQVTADVKWAGYYNPKPRRTVILGGMQKVMAHVIRVWSREGATEAADAFQRGAATVNNVANSDDEPGILFEGDDVIVTIPWENPT
jgi:hypothetical protein